MRWGSFKVDRQAADDSCCRVCQGLLVPLGYQFGIAYYPTAPTSEQAEQIRALWDIGEPADLFVCEQCIAGYAPYDVGAGADAWLSLQVRQWLRDRAGARTTMKALEGR